jgi:hypothetical protein
MKSCYFKPPIIAEMPGTCHHAQVFPLKMGSHKLFCLGWPGMTVLLISTSCVAWDVRFMSPCPTIDWDGGLANSLSQLAVNSHLLDLSLLRSWDYRPEPLCPTGTGIWTQGPVLASTVPLEPHPKPFLLLFGFILSCAFPWVCLRWGSSNLCLLSSWDWLQAWTTMPGNCNLCKVELVLVKFLYVAGIVGMRV